MDNDLLGRLNAAIDLINAGQLPEARRLLRALAASYPDQDSVWLWLATVAETPDEKIDHLRRVLQLNPTNAKARAALTQLTGETPAPPGPRLALPAVRLTPGLIRSLESAAVVILLGLAAFVIVLLAGSALIPALTPPTETPTPLPTRTPRPTVPTPTPISTVTLPPTWTPAPTDTPRPIPTRAPSQTPRPTYTRLPSRTPLPTNTPLPTFTFTPSDTPPPTETPTDTPPPTETPAPTETPPPTQTPPPTNTPIPSPSLAPTQTPTATP